MVRLIAEIGINFQGDVEVGKTLIKNAAEAKAWAVKFQYRDLDDYYHTSDEIGDSIVIAELERNDIGTDLHQAFKAEAKKHDLQFGMSFFRQSDLNSYIKRFGVPDFIKIPSAECLNENLVFDALQFGVEVIISTGGHDIQDVIDRYSHIEQNELLTVLHCVANYPAELGTQNLSKISELQKYFNAGYSSHDADVEVCLMAMAFGAQVIERHITIDKDGGGLDDSTSSDFVEFKMLGKFTSHFDLIKGRVDAKPNQGELLNMQNLGTSLYAVTDLLPGELVSISDFFIKAPRRGLSVNDLNSKFSKVPLKQPLNAGEPLSEYHFQNNLLVTEDMHQFISEHEISIPVRVHDFNLFHQLFPTAAYEFHLSYKEVLEQDLLSLVKSLPSQNRYSIHLPDYIPGNRILDPLSFDDNIAHFSWKIIDRIRKFADALETLSQSHVPIVGSFSQLSGRTNEAFFFALKEQVLDKRSILPQWLPQNAWYFGGTVKLDAFCNEEYVDLITRSKTNFCLDVCHLILSANSENADYHSWFNRLLPYAGHLHLADAVGKDSEGLMFGQGQLTNYTELCNTKNLKVIEVWQAHLNNGAGFIAAIQKLMELNK